FEDSDRFEEDSLCSWSSEPESLCNNWRGWRRPTVGFGSSKKSSDAMPEVHVERWTTTRAIRRNDASSEVEVMVVEVEAVAEEK
ncbi:zinc finger SWIM domain-containing protein 8 homolog, partial [Diprion similis]|uniref:zinc finger SWIM domain-containing protein 8 homolog n=1 Tax=Diprion similis TaxID=362088 RepID=UPI001EF7E284